MDSPAFTSRRPKRLIVCCDGTWQDGLVEKDPEFETNVRRIYDALESEDPKSGIIQSKLYSGGIGTGGQSMGLVGAAEGALGTGMKDEVEKAYDFLASNYRPGDEIFLFGFSRGSYTVRMLANLIGLIGVFSKKQLPTFSVLFQALSKRKGAASTDKEAVKEADALLQPHLARKRLQDEELARMGKPFSVKAVCVFDTVGTRGRPRVLRVGDKPVETYDSFGQPDQIFLPHIQYGFHALALDEFREDYAPVLWRLSDPDKPVDGQKLLQCWFSGAHTDIGGGYRTHDLSNITLTWVVANTQGILSYDEEYIKSISNVANHSYGNLPPHNSRTHIWAKFDPFYRPIPQAISLSTNEYIHASVRFQSTILPQVATAIDTPGLVAPLLPLEKRLRDFWPVAGPGDAPKPTVVEKAELLPMTVVDDNERDKPVTWRDRITGARKRADTGGFSLEGDIRPPLPSTSPPQASPTSRHWWGKSLRKKPTFGTTGSVSPESPSSPVSSAFSSTSSGPPSPLHISPLTVTPVSSFPPISPYASDSLSDSASPAGSVRSFGGMSAGASEASEVHTDSSDDEGSQVRFEGQNQSRN